MDIISGQHSPHELVRLKIANDYVPKFKIKFGHIKQFFFKK